MADEIYPKGGENMGFDREVADYPQIRNYIRVLLDVIEISSGIRKMDVPIV